MITIDHLLIFLDPFEDGWTTLDHFSIGLGPLAQAGTLKVPCDQKVQRYFLLRKALKSHSLDLSGRDSLKIPRKARIIWEGRRTRQLWNTLETLTF